MSAPKKQKAAAKPKKKASAKTEHSERYIKEEISTEAVLLQISTTFGNLAQIAKNFGVSRTTIYLRVKNSPELEAALADARESMVDNAESRLYANVMNGDTTALIFFLKTQGKKRGYSDSSESDRLIAEIYAELARRGLAGIGTGVGSNQGDSNGFVN